MIFNDRTIDLDAYLAKIGQREEQWLRWGTHWKTELLDRVVNGRQDRGEKLPWSKTHGGVQLRPGELSIWAGINGHRKSMLLGQVMLWLARESRICIASLEMRPEETLHRMLCQAVGGSPSFEQTAEFLEGCNGRICLYDQLDSVEADRILGVAHYAANELQCSHVVIDSLTKCGIAGDDYAKQKRFVDRLQWAAKSYGVHVHLVCHMRKGKDETERPGKFDVRGASEITDLADNVFITWKDKERDEAVQCQANGLPMTPVMTKALERPDQILEVAKQRHGTFEGAYALWFHRRSLQFLGSDDSRSMPWPDYNGDLSQWTACPNFGDHYRRFADESCAA
ncbi:MAG: hypothetical protein CALGDGBN_03557 [Pseudomonadales bacterium]|nr:hypothetical protein [Pseudomonadales bacterium]